MSLADSLLSAILRHDGDALVLHVGDRPYVSTADGPAELSGEELDLEAMQGMLEQLLPREALASVEDIGAVEHDLAPSAAMQGDRFSVVAARGGDDIWIELRRHRRPKTTWPAADAPVVLPEPVLPEPVFESAVEPAYEPAVDTSFDPAPPEMPLVLPPYEPALAAADGLSEFNGLSAFIQDTPDESTQPDVDVAAAGAADVYAAVGAEDDSLASMFAAALDAELDELDPPAEMPQAPAASAPRRAPQTAPPTSVAPATDAWWRTATPPVRVKPPAAPPAAQAPAPALPPPEQPAMPVPPPAAAFALPVPPVAPPTPAAAAARPSVPTARPARAVPPVAAPPVARSPVPHVAMPPAPPAASPAAQAPVATTPAPPGYAPAPQPPFEARPAQQSAPTAAFMPPPAPPAELPAPREVLPVSPDAAAHGLSSVSRPHEERDPAVILPLSRAALRSESVSRGGTAVRPGGIERLLRIAAARGASALYLTTEAPPAVRVDGDMRVLDGEPALSSEDVEAAVIALMPDGSRESEAAEWIRDLPEVGRVRITSFRDYRGPGALFRMISTKATSAEQLGLAREIQALASEPEGLVVVTGPRGSGKSTLLASFVDLLNRQRNDYVVTLEGQIRLVHESRGSLISQRELRGDAETVVAAARSALRENPDVLVIEDVRSPEVLRAALDAAGSGLLVFVSVTAASATAALERLVEMTPAEHRRGVQASLAQHLRGVVAQVLLRKTGGGRLAARELVLNTGAVAALVGDGQIAQLPRAIDSGRKLGLVPLNDALVAFVQSGAVDVREAYRRADDRAGLLALLKREGIDTSFVERLA